jgi:hypothetical protein
MTDDVYKNTAVPGSDFLLEPGCKHYIIVNDKSEIVRCWSSGTVPNRTPGKDDILIRENGGTQFRLFEDGEENPTIWEIRFYSSIYLYRWDSDNRLIVAKTPDEIAAEIEALRLAKLPGEIRSRRNSLLDEADKMLFDWRPMADEKREEWRVYMQELRDLTEQPGFPEAVEWPVEPE